MIPHSSITSTLDFYLTNANRNRTPERERGYDCGLRLNLQKLSSFSSVCPQCGLVVNTRKGFIMTCPAGFFSIGHLCRNPAVPVGAPVRQTTARWPPQRRCTRDLPEGDPAGKMRPDLGADLRVTMNTVQKVRTGVEIGFRGFHRIQSRQASTRRKKKFN